MPDGDTYVNLMGASIPQQCLRAGLLDEIQLHLVPVLLGAGVRLFDHLGAEASNWRVSGSSSPPA
jgi:dihydrofolate reductase